MSDRREPPLGIELPEMIQRASELDDPTVYRLCDVVIRHRLRDKGLRDPYREIGHDLPPAA